MQFLKRITCRKTPIHSMPCKLHLHLMNCSYLFNLPKDIFKKPPLELMLYWLNGNIKRVLNLAEIYHCHSVVIAFNFFIIIFIPMKEDKCLHLLCETTEQQVHSLQLIPFVHFADILRQLPWISIALLESNLSFNFKYNYQQSIHEHTL